MIDLTNFTYEERRDRIVSHIYKINSLNMVNTSSSNPPYIPDADVLDELARYVTHLVDSPTFEINVIENGNFISKYMRTETFINVDVIFSQNNSIILYTITNNGNTRCIITKESNYLLTIRDRGEKIDILLNR